MLSAGVGYDAFSVTASVISLSLAYDVECKTPAIEGWRVLQYIQYNNQVLDLMDYAELKHLC